MTSADFGSITAIFFGLIGMVGGGVAYFFGGFDKTRSKLEEEKDSSAKEALEYQKETNRILRDKNEMISNDLKLAGKRFDDATVVMTKMTQESQEMRKQLTDYKEILMARDQQSKEYRESTKEYQKQGMEVFKIVREQLVPVIIETNENVKKLIEGGE